MNTKEYNQMRMAQIKEARANRYKTDIKCDECGGDMVYTDDSLLCSNPPKRNVNCTVCDFRTYVLA